MKRKKELRSRFYALSPRFNYLPAGDRYLFAVDEPKYRFNVIGAGINGQEHISITLLEGRATIHGIYDPSPLSIDSTRKVYSSVRPTILTSTL
jgi:hypothetical protein